MSAPDPGVLKSPAILTIPAWASAGDTAERCAVTDADRQRLAVLYRQHAARIHRFLRDLLADDALAWDATQETFVRAFRRPEILHDAERATPWLFGVARKVSLEVRRTRRRTSTTPDHDQPACPGDCPERAALGREVGEVLTTALARLKEPRRAALVLRLDHGLSYVGIAQVMGWSVDKTKVEIFRARRELRGALARYEQGNPQRTRS